MLRELVRSRTMRRRYTPERFSVAGVLESMNQLRKMGFGFSIDDFGTGYSSLAYLQRLPVEQIKIDRSFIAQLTSDAGSAAIVRATIERARAVRLARHSVALSRVGWSARARLAFVRSIY